MVSAGTHMPVQERERMTELGWVDGGVEVFEEQMLGDQGVSAPRGS